MDKHSLRLRGLPGLCIKIDLHCEIAWLSNFKTAGSATITETSQVLTLNLNVELVSFELLILDSLSRRRYVPMKDTQINTQDRDEDRNQDREQAFSKTVASAVTPSH